MSTPQFDDAFGGLSDESICPGEDQQSDFRCLLCHFWDSPEVRAISASSITLTNGGASSRAANHGKTDEKSGSKLCQRVRLQAGLNSEIDPGLNAAGLNAGLSAKPNTGPDRAGKELSMLDFLSTDRDLKAGDRPNRDPEFRSANRSPASSSNLLNASDALTDVCDRPLNRPGKQDLTDSTDAHKRREIQAVYRQLADNQRQMRIYEQEISGMRHTLKSQSDKILQLEHQAVQMPQIHRAEIDRLYERARHELRLSEQKMAGVLRRQVRQQGGTTVNVGRSLRQMPTTYQVPKRGGPTWLGRFLGSIPFLMAMVAAGIALTVLLASIYPAWLPEAVLSSAVVSLLKVMAVVGLMGLFVTAVWELRR